MLGPFAGAEQRRPDGNRGAGRQESGGVLRGGMGYGRSGEHRRPPGRTDATDVNLGLELHHRAHRHEDGR